MIVPKHLPRWARSAFTALVAFVVLFALAAEASPARRKRRARPGTTPKSTPAARPAQNSSGGSIDDQIRAAQQRIRVSRDKVKKAVKKAGLSGTMIYLPSGSASGKKFTYSTVHAKKTVRGEVKATGSGQKAAATITASKAR